MPNASLTIDGTEVVSKADGVVTLKNATINSSVTINAGSNVSGIGQLVGISYVNSTSGNGNYVTLENNKNYHLVVTGYGSTADSYGWTEYYSISVDSVGNVSTSEPVSLLGSISPGTDTNAIRVDSASTDQGYFVGMVFEQGSTFDASSLND